MSSFKKYLWPKEINLRLRVITAFTLLTSAKIVSIQVPIFFKAIIDSLAITGDPLIVVPLATLLGYGIARSSASFFHEMRNVVFSPVSQLAIRQVASETFLHLHAMDLNWHLSRQTGGLSRAIDRGTRGIQQVLTAMLFTLIPTGLEIVFVSWILGVHFGWLYSGLTLGTVAFYGIFTLLMTRWRTKFRIEMNKLDNQAASVALDSLMNYETVKYFNNEKLEVERYEAVLKKYDLTQIKTISSLAFLNWGQNVIFSASLVLGMTFATYGIMNGLMSVGDVVMINGLLLQLAMPLNFLGSTYRETRQALIDMSTMFKLLNLKASITDSPDSKELDLSKGGDIVFKNVDFAYLGNPILKNACFTIPSGKKVAIVGSSGGGKSTILRLLYRFYDTDNGSIFIAGQDMKKIKMDSLRKSIGVVPQDLVLFNESIFYNILYGNIKATKQEVEQAAKSANIHDSILKMNSGYETIVGERGLKLSGGEKQRICLARALLKNPPILILDEVTSSLDSDSEISIQKAIDKVVQEGRTVIMISHRLKTIQNADKILVLENGKIVEEGTHSQLITLNGLYHRLVENQNLINENND